MEPVVGRKTKYTKISGSIVLESSLISLSSRASTPQVSPAFPNPIKAVLSVFIYSANNLDHHVDSNKKSGVTPSPQAVVKIGNQVKKTKKLKETQQAEFKEGFIFKLDQYWNAKPLIIDIDDCGHSLGSHSWSLADLVDHDVKRKIFVLDPSSPSQTLTVSINLMFPAE